jgi:hypothetical protein
MKKILLSIAFLVISGSAFAQFGELLSAGASLFGGGASLQSITNDYISGSKQVSSAQLKLLAAAKYKTRSDLATSAINNLTSGATAEQVEEANKIITEESKKVQEIYSNAQLKLDANGKKQFAAGFSDFAIGLLAYGKLALSVKGYRPGVNDLSAAATAIAIAKNVPDDMGNLKSTFSAIYDYAKSNNIEPPKDAAEVTKLLDNF